MCTECVNQITVFEELSTLRHVHSMCYSRIGCTFNTCVHIWTSLHLCLWQPHLNRTMWDVSFLIMSLAVILFDVLSSFEIPWLSSNRVFFFSNIFFLKLGISLSWPIKWCICSKRWWCDDDATAYAATIAATDDDRLIFYAKFDHLSIALRRDMFSGNITPHPGWVVTVTLNLNKWNEKQHMFKTSTKRTLLRSN